MILALDTSGDQTLVALGSAELFAGEVSLGGKEYVHSKSLFAAIEDLLSTGGYGVENLSAVAVSLGPGSFTGVRIGVVAGKTLAQLLDLPIMGVPIVDVLARGILPYHGYALTLIDARRGELFGSLYEADGQQLEQILPATVAKPEDLLILVRKLVRENLTVAVGSGALVYRDLFERGIEKAEFLPVQENYPKGSAMLEIAIDRFSRGEFDDLFSLTPLYLRHPDAERNILKMKRER